MEKVYLVTSGSYSDYRVDCAFSTKELAQEYVKLQYPGKSLEYILDKGDMSIEEYVLDVAATHIREGMLPFYVNIDLESGNMYVYKQYYTDSYGLNLVEIKVAKCGKPTTIVLQISGTILAKDEQGARKIAQEHYIRYKAENNL